MPLSLSEREALDAVCPAWNDVPASLHEELPDAVHRALQAGARVPLRYLGAGMTAIVFGDAEGKGGRAYKVGRRPSSATNVRTLTTEAEWLADAQKVPAIRGLVVRHVAFRPDLLVIVNREVPRESRPAGRDFWAVHQTIAAAMKTRGWGQPEYKDDSYVWTAKGPVLVDASSTLRFGPRLLAYARDIAEGRRPWLDESLRDLLWELRMEASDGRISEQDAAFVSRLLEWAAAAKGK